MARHYFADRALTSGMSESVVAMLGGWVPGSESM
jgi:hypothetical protein